MKGRRPSLSRAAAARLVLILSFFVLLELLCRTGVIDRVTMIAPSEMVVALAHIIVSGQFDQDIVFTTVNIAAAAALATVAGFFVGAAWHAKTWAAKRFGKEPI